jgi:hypothetical protein
VLAIDDIQCVKDISINSLDKTWKDEEKKGVEAVELFYNGPPALSQQFTLNLSCDSHVCEFHALRIS